MVYLILVQLETCVCAEELFSMSLLFCCFQVWQGIRHQCKLEGDGRIVTRDLVCDEIKRITDELVREKAHNAVDAERLMLSAQILEELVSKRDFHQFITTDDSRAIREC